MFCSGSSVAQVTIKKPGLMTPAERKDVVDWLRAVAAHLRKHGKDYTEGRFTSRYANRRPAIRKAIRKRISVQ